MIQTAALGGRTTSAPSASAVIAGATAFVARGDRNFLVACQDRHAAARKMLVHQRHDGGERERIKRTDVIEHSANEFASPRG